MDFSDYTESIPAFVCIILMPLSYSISDGILIGMICYVLLNMCCGKFKKISVTMYILAVLFILKYMFIVTEPKEEILPTNYCPTCGAPTCPICTGGTIESTETDDDVITYPVAEVDAEVNTDDTAVVAQ